MRRFNHRKPKNFSILFFLAISLNLSWFCFAQSKPGSQQEEIVPQSSAEGQKDSLNKNVQEQVVPSQPKTVTAIEIIGNKSISSNTIISKMKTRVGAPLLDNVISDDIKRLYLSGFFSDINIQTQGYKDGIKVILIVVERSLIEKISFQGMRRVYLKEDKLKEMLQSKEKQYLDFPKLKEDVETIKKLYTKRGFTDTQVDYKVDTNQEKNTTVVTFLVQEAKRIGIRGISLEGNRSYSKRRILKLMKTKRAWFFNPGILKEDVLEEDIKRIESFYQREGFADVKVAYSIRRDPKKPFVYIDIKIEQGKKYIVGNVEIRGNSVVAQKDIAAALKECLSGKTFSQEVLKQDIANIQGVYFDRGYIFARVEESTSLNPQTGLVDVVYNITEHEVAYVDKIKIRGNVKTKDIVIRRELRIHPGDRFDGEKLRRSKERLQNLGFFEEISYDTQDTDVANIKDLLVDVKETKTGAFSFGGGYSTVDQFVGFVEIEQKNFDWKNFPYFTGDGQELKLRASMGSISEGYSLSFTEPWLFDYPVSFGFDIYKEGHDRESDVGYGYDENRTGGDIRLGKEISEYLKTNLMYRYDMIKIGNIPTDATNDLRKEEGDHAISSMEFGLTEDRRDNVFTPTKGRLLSGSLEVAGGPFGGDKDFLKFFGRASKYFPLFKGSVLEFRGRLGLVDPYGDSSEIPIYERFFAGGAYTIRGYEERKVGPIDAATKDPLGGESMLIGNAEYTYPIFDFLRVAGFFDSGNVWKKMDDVGSGGFKSSFGLGLRLRTPIGPINLDYGIPLNKEPGEDRKSSGRFHFSVSHGF
jgi:outer membrane protein insertion porin family